MSLYSRAVKIFSGNASFGTEDFSEMVSNDTGFYPGRHTTGFYS